MNYETQQNGIFSYVYAYIYVRIETTIKKKILNDELNEENLIRISALMRLYDDTFLIWSYNVVIRIKSKT